MLLASRLRPGNAGGIRQLLPLLRPPVRRLRARFPTRAIAMRADGDFAKPELLDYAEYAGCSYAIGMPRNAKLEGCVEGLRQKAETQWNRAGKPVRLYTSVSYQTRSWSRARRSWPRSNTRRSGETCALWSPTGRAGPRRSSTGTSSAGRPRTTSRISRTRSPPIGSPARPTAPTPFGSSSTRSPTTCSCSFVGSRCAARRSPRPRSARFACASSRSAPASGAPSVASGFISPAAGPANRCSSTVLDRVAALRAPGLTPPTPARRRVPPDTGPAARPSVGWRCPPRARRRCPAPRTRLLLHTARLVGASELAGTTRRTTRAPFVGEFGRSFVEFMNNPG